MRLDDIGRGNPSLPFERIHGPMILAWNVTDILGQHKRLDHVGRDMRSWTL